MNRNEGVTDAIVPFLCIEASPNTPWTWNYSTTAQTGFNNRAITYPRGKILGGSSSINFMFYTRGSYEDFDRIADVTGDSGWSWNNLQSYILKVRNYPPCKIFVCTTLIFSCRSKILWRLPTGMTRRGNIIQRCTARRVL